MSRDIASLQVEMLYKSYLMSEMFLLLLTALCLVNGVLADCDADNGPAGGIKCIAASTYYNQYQWATCLSNDYIKLKSHHRHACADGSRKYCYYQCMIEVYGKAYGQVYSECSCTPNSKIWSRLPSACLSPSGKSCNWYRDCLEEKYSCKDTSNAYAIRYAERFCNVYERDDLSFSPYGQQWLNEVRKCLQVSLVPILRPWRSPSCLYIRREALESHTKCYKYTGSNITSVCNLDCSEFYKIFFAIKASFRGLDTAWGSFKSLWNLQDTCGLKCTRDWFTQNNTAIKIVKAWVEIFHQKKESHNNYQQSNAVSLPESDKQNRFADQVVTFIAKSLKWNSIIMDWMAYPGATSANLYVVLADKKALGIVQTSIPAVNFNNTIAELAAAINSSTIPVQVDGSNVWLKSLELCSDKDCRQSNKFLAMSKRPPIFPNSGKVMAEMSVFCVLISLMVQCLVVFW